MKYLNRLQSSIEELQAIATDMDVSAYVVDDTLRQAIPGAQDDLPEQLFVRQDPEGVEIALYIASDVVQRLERDDPMHRLHPGNLESYCIALEGVSHFVFLAWRAQQERPVTALELEIQAEVDKFVGAWLLLAQQGQPLESSAKVLLRQLFVHYEVRDAVPEGEVERYHTATRVAKGYCGHLARRYGRDRTTGRIRRDVRRFYRQGLADKLRAA